MGAPAKFLFDLDFARIICARNRMFDLNFTVEAEPVIETMPKKQNETLEVSLIAARVLEVIIVGNLAIATDGGCRSGGRQFDRRGRCFKRKCGWNGRNFGACFCLAMRQGLCRCFEPCKLLSLGCQLCFQRSDLRLERCFAGQCRCCTRNGRGSKQGNNSSHLHPFIESICAKLYAN